MSRLIDKALRKPAYAIPPWWNEDPEELRDVMSRFYHTLERAEVIVADNVSEYLYAETPQEDWLEDAFPCVAPPFEIFWIEWRRPSKVVSEVHGELEASTSVAKETGWLFITRTLEEGGWQLRGVPLISFPEIGIGGDEILFPAIFVDIYVNPDGTIDHWDTAALKPDTIGDDQRRLDHLSRWSGTISAMTSPALLALCFLNCFAGETLVVTRHGPQPIADLAGKTEIVMTRDGSGQGKWTTAEFAQFGQQPLFGLTVERNGSRRTIRTTGNHRWFVAGRPEREATTLELNTGDRLTTIRPRSAADTCKISAIGVAHGYTFGDGSRSAHEAYVDLCGPGADKMLRFFPSPRTLTIRGEGSEWLRVVGLPRSFKERPRTDEGSSYLYSFLAGWFAADGSVGKQGQLTLYSADPVPLEWMRRVALVKLGILISEPHPTKRVGINGIESEIWSVRIERASLQPDFFVQDHQHRAFTSMEIKTSPNHWRVVSVEDLGAVEPVYCATVPDTECFVLDGMLLTGNCKNVVVDINEPPLKLSKKHERKRGRKLTSYRTLQIDPMRKILRREGGSEHEGLARALHICRGHFKTYSAESPLMGRHTGTYWWSPQLRGSKEEGQVVKRYSVKAGERG